MTNQLTFKSHPLTPIIINNLPYLGVSQIGTALQYANPTRLIKIFLSHADEFTPDMSFLTTVDTAGGKQQVRVFSLRGCHLLAMFSKTPVAKEFRRWVLDLIEQQNQPVTNCHQLDAKAIGGIVKKCCAVAVREELANLLAGDKTENWECSDQDLIYWLYRWYNTKSKAETLVFRQLHAERDALMAEITQLKEKAQQIKQLAIKL